MTESSDRICEVFAAGSRDLTPAAARHASHVLFAPVSRDAEVSRHCASVLSDAELQKRDRLAAECDKARFEQRRAFRRFCGATALGTSQPLSEIVFEETLNGRPYLPESPKFWFSFSSCRLGLLGAWSATHAIGVDLEDQTRDLEATELARRFFSADEAEVVQRADGAERLRTFYRFWTSKEAALKAIGEGLPYGLDAFEFEIDPILRIIHAPAHAGGPESFGAHVIRGTGSCATLVIRNQDDQSK
ncbi:hypothetical protein DRQ32_10780 [bacterium]|nr:MAG: hypothetical protein DRQ32_10780 [bacterium]